MDEYELINLIAGSEGLDFLLVFQLGLIDQHCLIDLVHVWIQFWVFVLVLLSASVCCSCGGSIFVDILILCVHIGWVLNFGWDALMMISLGIGPVGQIATKVPL